MWSSHSRGRIRSLTGGRGWRVQGREGSLGETASVGTVPEALGLVFNSDTYNEKRMSKEAFHSHCDSETDGNQLSFSSPGQNHE